MKTSAFSIFSFILVAAAFDTAGEPNGCKQVPSCRQAKKYRCNLDKKSCGPAGDIQWKKKKQFVFTPNIAIGGSELFCVAITVDQNDKGKYFYQLDKGAHDCTVNNFKQLGSSDNGKVDIVKSEH
ncbi:hypothetical protein B0J12DRAFT_701838 [Macrophomina phaseolina]|uniref:Secreted protein n=1 Tax=Macrophomina phaseolina TaxID=35725 RepID=A0ABQ8G4B3_9PEZI|nr:hypothetical protein B0J12DRAFT_701838 [Macrophomina phaseolina]